MVENFEERVRELISDAKEGKCHIFLDVSDDNGLEIHEKSDVVIGEDYVEVFKKDRKASYVLPFNKIIIVKCMGSDLIKSCEERKKEQLEEIKKALGLEDIE